MEQALRIFADGASLSQAAAEVFVATANEAVGRKGAFHVCLSGGSTPRALYSLLATDSQLRSRVPWQQSYFFFGDERLVPPDHPDSNFRMASEAMLSRVPVHASQVFRIRGELDAGAAAAAYEQTLKDAFRLKGGELPRFDLLLLGIGHDGHTASLFPHTAAIEERQRLVVDNRVPKLNTVRITLTLPVLNNSASVTFLVQGQEK